MLVSIWNPFIELLCTSTCFSVSGLNLLVSLMHLYLLTHHSLIISISNYKLLQTDIKRYCFKFLYYHCPNSSYPSLLIALSLWPLQTLRFTTHLRNTSSLMARSSNNRYNHLTYMIDFWQQPHAFLWIIRSQPMERKWGRPIGELVQRCVQADRPFI